MASPDLSAFATISTTLKINLRTSWWATRTIIGAIDKLFIFDDTLLHVSANETDQLRYCIFVDILRPSPFLAVMSAVVAVEGWLNKTFKFISYSGCER